VGRGLRRVRGKGIAPDEPQICSVVDHPKLEHQWLWDIFGRDTRIRSNVKIDDLFDETEDLPEPPPKQQLVKPQNVIDVPDPDPALIDEGEFDLGEFEKPPEPIQNWREVLAALKYDPTVVEITRVDIAGVVGKELTGEQWKQLYSAPELPDSGQTPRLELSEETIREAIKETVLQMAEELTVEAGYATVFKGDVYSALMGHIREKFLNGSSLGLAERADPLFAWKTLPQVKKTVSAVPGLIAGIIEYGNQ